MKRAAVFFDRDNTLIANDGYLGDPNGVALVEGAADAIARARDLGYAVVVFSNQSGVARGMFAEEAVHAVNHRMDEMLLDENAHAVIDRHEFCPYHPDAAVERYRQDSDLRKPKPGMILQAERQLALDLPRSWVVGDAPRDVDAGRAAGCRTILVKNGSLAPSEAALRQGEGPADFEVASLAEAMEVIAKNHVSASDSPAEPAPIEQRSEPRPGQAPESEPELQREEERGQEPEHEAEPKPDPEREPDATREAADAPASESEPTPEPEPATELPVRLVADAPPATPDHSPTPEPEASAVQAERVTEEVEEAPPAPRVSMRMPEPEADAPTDTPTYPEPPPPRMPAVAPSVNETDAAPAPTPRGKSRSEILLSQILDELRRRHEHPETDFSVSKLMAGVVQVLALAAVFWAYIKGKEPNVAVLSLLTGIFLQVFTIALLIMGRQK